MTARNEKVRQFASDNQAGICPEAWAAMAEANAGHVHSYGEDRWTERAADLIRQLFETDCEVFFVFNGTAANSLALASMCQSYHSIVCAETAHVEMEFPYFMVKAAPVSKLPSLMDYTARFDAAACGKEIDFVLTVKVPVTTLCPCSKAISQYGAHNQRGLVTVQLRSTDTIWIEDVIAMVESSASSELYSLLKRADEKAVTERAYENPVFVEDLVRNVVVKLEAHPLVVWYKVEAENFESIHNHSAYAVVTRRKDG